VLWFTSVQSLTYSVCAQESRLNGAEGGHGCTVGLRGAYQVNYAFTGFYAPIDPTMVNVAKAGRTVPVIWRLTDANEAPVTDPASVAAITSTTSACSPAQAADDVETYAGNSGLQNLGDGYWQFNWKTPKGYAGQCRTLKLNLADGATHTAEFRFT